LDKVLLTVLFAVSFSVLFGTAEDAFALTNSFGPSPYLEFADSPFSKLTFSKYFHLETFEDGELNTPGIVGAAFSCITNSPGCLSGPEVDAVDADDGAIDGFGNGAETGNLPHSLKCDSFCSFQFDREVLGELPTHVGLVWTDGAGRITFEAFDGKGTRIHFDNSRAGNPCCFNGQTSEDRFYGVANSEGIATIVLRAVAGSFVEMDHLQYGFGAPINNPPVIAQPENIEVMADIPPDGAIVNYILPIATDDVEPEIPVTCNPPPNSLFRVGQKAVVCTATDNAANTVQIIFRVTITTETDVAVTKTLHNDLVLDGKQVIFRGETFSYTITFSNIGTFVAKDVEVRDFVKDSISNGNGPGNIVDISPSDEEVICDTDDDVQIICNFGDIEPGGSRELRYGFQVDEDADFGTIFRNDVELETSGFTIDTDESNNVFTIEGPEVIGVDLEVTKTATIEPQSDCNEIECSIEDSDLIPGGKITYEVTITNNSPIDVEQVLLSDTIKGPAKLVGLPEVDPADDCMMLINEGFDGFDCELDSKVILAGGSRTITYDVLVDDDANSGEIILNDVQVELADKVKGDPNEENNIDFVELTVGCPKELSIQSFFDSICFC